MVFSCRALIFKKANDENNLKLSINHFQYIRMTDEDSVEDLIRLMIDFWKIMEPKAPNLVISVVGGAKNFKLDGRMRDTFSTGLIKVINPLVTNGFSHHYH